MWHARQRKALHHDRFNLFPSVLVCEPPHLIPEHVCIIKVLFSRRNKTFVLQACEVRSSALAGQKARRASEWKWREMGKRTAVFAD